nr:beta-propeller domain-containing protein [Pirellulaceae bacterium]
RLTVISHQYDLYPQPLAAMDAAMWRRPGGGESKFHVTVYDVSAPETPQLVSRLEIEGNYVDSRMIGDTVYLVSSHSFYLPAPEIVPGSDVPDRQEPGETLRADVSSTDPAIGIMPWPGPNPDGSGWVYETREQYWERIGDQVLDLALPNYALRDAAGSSVQSGLLSAAEATYRPLGGQDDQLVSITAFDVGAAQPSVVASSSAPLGWANTVYVSLDNLYLVSTTWSDAGESSRLFKFALQAEDGQIPLAATGRVPGRVLNSFSLDERGEHLRIVTQRGWRAGAQNSLYVLEQTGDKLVLRGQLEDLAPGEELYSVRFLGERAFVVTFGPDGGNWIDPLFTIDLSDPAAPRIEGELEIPGFSNYLQLIDGQFLLGLGRNADESNGRQLEPQVSLFDASDFANPSLTDRVSFGDVNSWSEAFFNHHAVSYFPDQQILAVPLETWFPFAPPILREGDAAADASPWPTGLSQLWVFRIDTTPDTTPDEAAEPRIRVLGTIQHDRTILRSLRIGKQLFSISTDTIQVHGIFDPGEKRGELYFGPRAMDDWFSVDRGTREHLLDVLANDRLGTDAGAWSIASVEQPETGAVAIGADGLRLLYTPASGFWGQESFVYTIAGPGGMTDDARVTVEVTAWSDQRRMTELAQRDLAQRLSVPVEEIGVVSVDQTRWPDSCLGVPAPDQGCLMVITPGFHVTLQHGMTTYVYHTDMADTVILAKTDDGSQTVTEPGPSDPLVRVRLEATDASGQVITTIEAGQTLTLNLYVDDLRDSGAGVYATYADIFYPARLVTVQEESIAYDEAYANGRAGDVERPGLVNELGAFAGLQTLGSGERLLARVSFVARRAGTAAFVPTPADIRGHETLVYGLNEVVPPGLVDWQGIEVQVLGGWRNTQTPPDVNDDGRITPQDALHCINAINAHGKQHLERAELQAAAGMAAAADQFFFDVDGDDYLTPRDVLLVVNRLNAGPETTVTSSGDAGLPARPLASWVDWKSLRALLQEDRWQQPLQTLQLSPERTLDLIHEFLVSVNADRLDDLLQDQTPLDVAQWKAALTPVLDAIRQNVSVDQLLDLADQLQANFDNLDLPSILPGLAPQISLTAAGEALHDAFFARLSNPLFLLDLLEG